MLGKINPADHMDADCAKQYGLHYRFLSPYQNKAFGAVASVNSASLSTSIFRSESHCASAHATSSFVDTFSIIGVVSFGLSDVSQRCLK